MEIFHSHEDILTTGRRKKEEIFTANRTRATTTSVSIFGSWFVLWPTSSYQIPEITDICQIPTVWWVVWVLVLRCSCPAEIHSIFNGSWQKLFLWSGNRGYKVFSPPFISLRWKNSSIILRAVNPSFSTWAQTIFWQVLTHPFITDTWTWRSGVLVKWNSKVSSELHGKKVRLPSNNAPLNKNYIIYKYKILF